ncbi:MULTISPECIES: hypothetical protein [Bifidobacterium]|uniref:hypothetical protein n=1 Tax=Bifidobacterium TaxID=1678 RepID=UPI0018DD7FF8|nr:MULTISPECIES: hypothetical protein [Bifidobacterium]
MPMHFIHRFDRPHMRLADSPQGEAGSGGGQPGPDNTRILAQSETQGTATATSSIYAVRYGSSEGDQAVTGLTNGGVNVQDRGQLQDKPAYRIRIEFFVGLAVFGGKAATRLKGSSMASRKTAGTAAKKRAEAEPTLAVTPNEPVQEVTAQELDKEKEPPAAPDYSAAVARAGRYEAFEDGCM